MSVKATVHLPDELRAEIGDVESLSAWLVEAARMRLAVASSDRRWRPVLGDTLADRVVRVAGSNPAEFCRMAVEAAVERAAAAVTAARVIEKARAQCQHPEADRRGNRCGRCGTRGLPAVSKLPAAKPAATGGRR